MRLEKRFGLNQISTSSCLANSNFHASLNCYREMKSSTSWAACSWKIDWTTILNSWIDSRMIANWTKADS
jgi:hypothetical protein